MKKILTVLTLIALIMTLSVTAFAALEDINEDTCTVVKELVKKGTPTVDGVLDAIYTDSMTLMLHGPASSYFISGGSCEDTTATGTVYALHDDNYVYVFFCVRDHTLIQADQEYVEIAAHPHLVDSVEVRVGDDLEDHFAPYDGSNGAHHLIFADAHGVRVSCYEDSLGDDVDKLKGKSVLADDGKTYCVELAIPLQKPFADGEIIEFEFQINDLQDHMDSMCAVGSGYPHHLVAFTVESDLAADSSSDLDGKINKDTATVVNSVVKKYTPVIDGEVDEEYDESLQIKLHGPAGSYFINEGSCDDTTATATVWATYDESCVYVMYEVVDETLTRASDSYVNTSEHPHLSDAVEVRVGDGGNGHFASYDSDTMSNSQHLIYADAHGRRLTSYNDMISASELQGKAVIDSDGKTYRVEMAIPTVKPFKAGDTVYFEFQVDDLQNETGAMCAIGSGYPHKLVAFTLGDAVTTKLSAENKTVVGSGTVDVPIVISGNSGLAGLGLSVTFDDCLVLKEVTRGDALGTLEYTPTYGLEVQPVKLLFDGVDADKTNGTVVILTFEVSDTAESGSYDVDIKVTDAYNGELDDVVIADTTATITVMDFIAGDINSDGAVDLKDVTALRRYLAGGYNVSVNKEALDVNLDSAVDLKDVTTLRRYLAGGYGVELR